MNFRTYEDIPAVDLGWKDENRKYAGGEGVIMERTFENDVSRAIIENAGICLQIVSELVASVSDEPPESQMVNSICWQALRDMKSSLFLAMSGHYRSAFVVQRGVIEVVGSAIFFAHRIIETEQEGWEQLTAWINGEKDASPSFQEIMGTLADVVPWLSESIYTSLQEDREFGNRYVHTPIGDNPFEVLFDDDSDSLLIRTWSSHYDLNELKTWYVGFVTDLFYLASLTLEFHNSVGPISESFDTFLQCYSDIASDESIRGVQTNIESDL